MNKWRIVQPELPCYFDSFVKISLDLFAASAAAAAALLLWVFVSFFDVLKKLKRLIWRTQEIWGVSVLGTYMYICGLLLHFSLSVSIFAEHVSRLYVYLTGDVSIDSQIVSFLFSPFILFQ